MLTDILPLIQKVSERQNLSVEEALEAYDTCFREDLDSYYLFVLNMGLHTKGETSDELLGLCKSIESVSPRIEVSIDPNNMIDVSGTGGDRIKTFNVSTCVAFVVASAGIVVPKQAFFAVTGYSGSADLLQVFGVDTIGISASSERVRDILERVGIVPYHLLLHLPEEFAGMRNWITKRREIGLNYVTPFHFVAFAYAPVPINRRIYGVFDERYLRLLAELYQKLGYQKGLVFHGEGGLDEISNIGPTKICEFRGEDIEEYTVTPSDLGIREAKSTDILARSKESNVQDFLRILYGQETGPKKDLVLANAAAAFYVMDKVSSLKDGVALAASLLDQGKPREKLEQLVAYCGDREELARAKTAVGIE